MLGLRSACTTSVKVDGSEACVNVPTAGKLFCEDFYKAQTENVTEVERPEAESVPLELVFGIPAVLLVLVLCVLDLRTKRRMYRAWLLIAEWVEHRVQYEKKRRLQHKVRCIVLMLSRKMACAVCTIVMGG